jgi:uncharacterized protein YeeX (DUF496 family)
MSNKHDKFVELAEKRVNNAMKQIQLIGNLSNTNYYEYGGEEVDKIFKTLRHELKLAQDRFFQNARNDSKFRLK